MNLSVTGSVAFGQSARTVSKAAGRITGAGLCTWPRRLHLAQVLFSLCEFGLTLQAIFEVVPMRRVAGFLLAWLASLPEAPCATTFRQVCP